MILDMRQECVFIIFFQIIVLYVNANEIPIYNIHHVGTIMPYPRLTSLERNHKQICVLNNKWVECSTINKYNMMNSFIKNELYDVSPYNIIREFNSNLKSYLSEAQPLQRRIYMPNRPGMMHIRSLPDPHMQGRLPAKTYQMHHPGYTRPDILQNIMNNALSMPLLHPHASNGLSAPAQSAKVNSTNNVAHSQLTVKPSVSLDVSSIPHKMLPHKNVSNDKFTHSLDQFERQFYMITFTKLTTISPTDRQENGMSFVQSGFFLLLTLMAFSSEVDSKTRAEIDRCIGFRVSDMDTIDIVRHFMSSLPNSSDKLKLRWSSRLMLWPGKEVISPRFIAGGAAALDLHIDRFNGTETSEQIATTLNQKVEIDSGGAIRDTFDEDDVSGGVTAVLLTTMYVRGSWRTAPTVLNGTRPFHDHTDAPQRTVRMIRINDYMNYTDLEEWDAQAIEISYATPGLSLLMLIPRGNSLKSLVEHVTNTSIGDITAKMRTMRVAATVPLYTLRMTLLLPNKLQALGIPSLMDVSNITQASSLKLSHAVQRIMFWSEAGRNAYKDDGIEWDQTPDLEVVVDRPYIFFVRWRNITLINGNFVL